MNLKFNKIGKSIVSLFDQPRLRKQHLRLSGLENSTMKASVREKPFPKPNFLSQILSFP